MLLVGMGVGKKASLFGLTAGALEKSRELRSSIGLVTEGGATGVMGAAASKSF